MLLYVMYPVTTAFCSAVTITAVLAIADKYFSFIFLRFLFTLFFFIKLWECLLEKGGDFGNA